MAEGPMTSTTSLASQQTLSPDSITRHRASSDASTSTASSFNIKGVSTKRQEDFEKHFGERLQADRLNVDADDADFLTVTQTQSADLQSSILLHGRLYLTRYHLCFRSNILGAVTERIHPLRDVVDVEKGTTAKWIQNAVYVKALVNGERVHHGYGSMADRDAMFDQIVEWWRIQAPEKYDEFVKAHDIPVVEAKEGNSTVTLAAVPELSPDTDASDVKHTEGTGDHLKEVAIDAKIPLPLEQAYNLIYHNNDFAQHFYVNVKKLTGDWQSEAGGQTRNMTYVMHMTNPLGPAKSDCIGTEVIVASDPEDSHEVESETQTLDVPSGKNIAGAPATRILSTTQVDWTGSSMLKSAITPAVIRGQKEHHEQLVSATLDWIDSHREDFGKSSEERLEPEIVPVGEGPVTSTVPLSATSDKTLVDHASDIPGNPIMIAISLLCAILLYLQLNR
ncbi:hypothetical protein CI109_103323 [Kwoniella shandongensis]|uniref:VASt domain-containing protein n=1 Tax=Kwoniella shandongensis TaxID=1734106 RepID=A0AAJ8LGM7_9TREE